MVWARLPPFHTYFPQESANIGPAPYQTLERKPLLAFSSAQLTLNFTPTTQYDQAGLLLILHPPADYSAPESVSQGPEASDKYWIKTGVELYDAKPRASVVACKEWADWSIATLEGASKNIETTFIIQRSTDHMGPSFWVYKEDKEGREALREICWVFALGDGPEAGSGWEVEVAAYACRPNDEVSGELEAGFKDIKVEWL